MLLFTSIIAIFLSCTILLILLKVVWMLLRSFYVHSLKQELNEENYLEYFQELKLEGKLSESEFRIIKRQLSERHSEK
ncbi:MAG: hypothetical protein ACRCUY_00915 [Thermoguttaceae bacterium]